MSEKSESRSKSGAAAPPEGGGEPPAPEDDPSAPEAGQSGDADPVTEATPEQAEERKAEEELADQLDRLQTEFEALNDRHLRLAAEFENYRKRARGEMTEAWSRAQADLVRRVLDSLDDLQRVGEQDPGSTTVETLMQGVDLVEQKLRGALEQAGLQVVEPEGEPFDPEIMEAMLSVPAEEAEQDETVAQVLQKGYLFNDHLVRPARVSVYKND